MTILTEFNSKFKVNEFKIYETEHWVWSLRPHQATIGAGIISLKRECATFGELEPQEYCDLNNIIKVIEPTLKNMLNYDVMNYLMLMMFDKCVHYHVFPRYEKPVNILGEEWKDETWPAVPKLLGEPLSNERLEEITLLIKSKIQEN